MRSGNRCQSNRLYLQEDQAIRAIKTCLSGPGLIQYKKAKSEEGEASPVIIFQNGNLVTEQGVLRADLAADEGKIIRIGENIQAGDDDRKVDCTGKMVLPGMIDGHTHFEMEGSGTVTADDFESGTQAAVLGGTTCIIDFATQERGKTLKDALEAWHRRADGHCSCNYGFHMSVTDWNEHTRTELQDMFDAGISSFKLYMAYDNLRVRDAEVYEILTELKKLGGITGVHCENGDLVAEGQLREKAAGRFGPASHPASRPPEVEAEAVHRLLTISQLTGCTVNIVHLSSLAGLEEVRRFREAGRKVKVETCPQYLLLDDAVFERLGFESGRFICSPPIRSRTDRDALVQAMLNGEIDTLSTDHCSYTLKQKEAGENDFTRVPNGLPGVEQRVNLILGTFVAEGQLSWESAVRMLATEPAKQFGLYPRKGVLRAGADADLVIYDPAEIWTVTAAEQRQKSDYTPYEGIRLRGRVRDVWLAGQEIVKDCRIVTPGKGNYLFREAVEV